MVSFGSTSSVNPQKKSVFDLSYVVNYWARPGIGLQGLVVRGIFERLACSCRRIGYLKSLQGAKYSE